MIQILNYIINIFDKYNSFNEYFIGEIGNSITIFQYINSCCLILFFIFLFFRFFILKFGFKKVLIFIIKRTVFIVLFSFAIYVSSDFTICDHRVNKNLKVYTSSLTDTQKQYIALTCFIVIAGYLVYKGLSKLNTYERYNTAKIKFDTYIPYDDVIKQTIVKEKNSKLTLYNQNKEDVKVYTEYVLASCNRLDVEEFKVKLKAINHTLMLKYESVKRINTDLPNLMHFNLKQQIVEGRLEAIIDRMYVLIGNDKTKPYSCDFNLLLEKEKTLVMELLALDILYNNTIKDLVGEPRISRAYYQEIVDTSIEVDRALSAIIQSSDELIPIINSAKFLAPSSSEIAFYYAGKNGLNPSLCGLDGYLTGGRFFLLNTGYILFYPPLFVCNKMLGVYNPLSFSTFKESLWYFITFKMFF